MLRLATTLAIILILLQDPLAGQPPQPRSADYLFPTSVDDARAVWLNPAGLAVVPEASIFGEFVLRRSTAADLRLAQWTLGLNSQGFSVAYQRDLLPSDSSNTTYRVAIGRGMARWSVGAALSYHNSDRKDTGLDAGFRYHLASSLAVALVVRNLGAPTVRADTLYLTGVAAVSWGILGGALSLDGEAVAADRAAAAGYDMAYRTGVRLSVGKRVPVAGFANVTLGPRLAPDVWCFGLAVGGDRRGIVVTTLEPGASTELESLSLTGLALNRLAARRR